VLATVERSYGNMQLVYWDRADGRVEAASDPRGIGAAQVIEPAGPALPTRQEAVITRD
jgi:gamma-glutamyltranspeptidase/glutathione hydrolase